MWLPSILLLLEAMDPIMVMLPKRLDFLVQICQAIESSVCNVLGSEGTLLVDKQKVIFIFSKDSSDIIIIKLSLYSSLFLLDCSLNLN